ncbi:MAG: hypothetical protein DRJ69_06375 [Thermoprotei archaeon]|nr:MAG: hypothetical protein DRJ69_06375 [Thermoprotei archaeon]
MDAEHDRVYVGARGDWYYRAWLEDGEWRTEHITVPSKQCAVASFIAPDPYNPDRLWIGAEGEGGRLFTTELKGSSFVAVGFWLDGEWVDLHGRGNYATMIAIDRHGEGEDPSSYMIDTPYGPGAKIAYVPQGGACSLMKTTDGGYTWRRAYEGVYGDTMNQVTYLRSGVLAGALVVTCVSGTQVSLDLGDTWLEGVDFTLGDVGYGLPGYAWSVASPPEELEGVYDLLVATGYPSPVGTGDGLYAVDVDGLMSGRPAPVKRLYPNQCFDVVVVDGVAYVGDMDSGVGVVDLSTYEVSKLPGIPEDEAGMNLLYADGQLIVWTIKCESKTSDSFFFANPRAQGSIYVYDLSTGECVKVYSGSRVIAVSVRGEEMLALNVEKKLIHFVGDTVDKEVTLSLEHAKFSDMVVDWDLGVLYVSTFDTANPVVLYAFLDEVWERGAEALHPLGEGILTRRARCLELVNHTLFVGTEGLSTWRITPELVVEEAPVKPPVVSIDEPSEGACFQVGDEVEVSLTIEGEVDEVVVKVDGVTVATLTAPPWTTSWATTGLQPGTYTITAIAVNPAGSSNDAVTITITLPPSSPGGGAPGPGGPQGPSGPQTRPSRCIIATVAFGSELAPEVQFLRGFRDHVALNTFAGRAFMDAFHTWYYSWSPYIANWLQGNEPAKAAVRTLIMPLLAILHVATWAHQALASYPELAITTAGIVASTLLSLTYVTPLLMARWLMARRLGLVVEVKQPRLLLKAWLASLVLVAASVATSTYVLAAVSTSMLVLATMALTAKTLLWAASRTASVQGSRLKAKG